MTILGLFIIIQLVPYGRAHSNPPVRLEPQWDHPQANLSADEKQTLIRGLQASTGNQEQRESGEPEESDEHD